MRDARGHDARDTSHADSIRSGLGGVKISMLSPELW
jgi:hypothetical protein